MKHLFLMIMLLPLVTAAQIHIERVGTIPGCICTDLVIESPYSIIVSCKDGYVIHWTPSSRDTLLAIPSIVETDGESGLLGVTYLDTRMYINYTDHAFNQILAEVLGSELDTILLLDAPTNFPNHRGGDLSVWNDEVIMSVGEGVGESGYLIAVPSMDILATGLRNPWRIYPGLPGLPFYVTDVGDYDYEEINILEPGKHYGWPCYEGTLLFADTCGSTVPPWIQYERNGGTAVIGGYESPFGFVFADHYKPHLYTTDGTIIDTFPGYRYLTAIDGDLNGGMAVGWDGRIYEITHGTTSIRPDLGTELPELFYCDVVGNKYRSLEGLPLGWYFDNRGRKYFVHGD